MNVRDSLFSLCLFAAVILAGQRNLFVESLALANVSALLLIFYALRGRWQAVPLAVIAVATIALRVTYQAAFPWWLSTILAILVLLFASILFFSPVPRMPKPTGTHKIGLVRAQIRRGDRRIQAYIWYPARAAELAARTYFTKSEAETISAGYKSIGAPGFLTNHMRLVSTHSTANATVEAGRYPLVIFNHGGGLYPLQNFSLMEELCSHGMICISVGHASESLALDFADDAPELINSDLLVEMAGSQTFQDDNLTYLLARDGESRVENFRSLALHKENKLTELAEDWADDSLHLIDALLDGNVDGVSEELRSSMVREQTAYVGMSLGGSTAALCCLKDRHAKAGVNLDGFIWSFELSKETLSAPFLQFYADPNSLFKMIAQKTGTVTDPVELSPDLPMSNDIYFVHAEKNSTRLICPGIAHMGFTDAALSARPGLSSAFGLGARVSRRSIIQMNKMISAFLSKAFNDSNSDLELDSVVSELENSRFVIRQSNAPLAQLRDV